MGGVRALITKDELELENDQLICLFYKFKYQSNLNTFPQHIRTTHNADIASNLDGPRLGGARE